MTDLRRMLPDEIAEPQNTHAALIRATAHPRRGRPKRLQDYGLTPLSSKRVALKPYLLASTKRIALAVGGWIS